MIYPQITIIAPGLLGGSLGLAARRRGLAERVVGVARRQETIDQAVRLGALDSGGTDLAEGVRGSQLVVLAAPVRACIKLLPELARTVPPEALVTDLGSTKAGIVAAAEESLPKRFIGGHPMAGSHSSGISAARADLFDDATWILCGAETSQMEGLKGMVRGLGARPLLMSAEVHDRLVARASHLPHVAAAALVESANSFSLENLKALDVAASGFRDSTRIAAGHPQMWTDICLTNREAVAESLGNYIEILQRVRQMIASGNEQAIGVWLQEMARVREALDSHS